MPIWVRFFFTLIFYFFIFYFYMKIKNKNKKKWNLGLSERKERERKREREKKKSGERMSLRSCSKNFFSSFSSFFFFFFFFSPRHLKNKMKRETGAVTNPFCSFFFFFFFTIHFVKQKLFKQKSFFFVFFGRWKKVSVFFEKVFLCWKEFKVLCDQKEKTKAVLFGLKSYSKALSRKQSSLKNNNYYPHI